MQIHGPSRVVHDIKVAECYPGAVALYFPGEIEIVIYSCEDADELIKAAVEAKRLLLGDDATDVPAGPASLASLRDQPHYESPLAPPNGYGLKAIEQPAAQFCADQGPDGFLCIQTPGHDGPHASRNGVRSTWAQVTA